MEIREDWRKCPMCAQDYHDSCAMVWYMPDGEGGLIEWHRNCYCDKTPRPEW